MGRAARAPGVGRAAGAPGGGTGGRGAPSAAKPVETSASQRDLNMSSLTCTPTSFHVEYPCVKRSNRAYDGIDDPARRRKAVDAVAVSEAAVSAPGDVSVGGAVDGEAAVARAYAGWGGLRAMGGLLPTPF